MSEQEPTELVYAFSAGLLSYNERLPRSALPTIKGDRHLYVVILARITVAERIGKACTCNKLELEAVDAGLSPRTATRMCRQMVKSGVLIEDNTNGTKALRVSDQGKSDWAEIVWLFAEQMKASGFIDLLSK